MPHRSRTSVQDLPVDVVVSLVRDPTKFDPHIQKWLVAKQDAVDAKEEAGKRLAAAEKAEESAKQAQTRAENASERLRKATDRFDKERQNQLLNQT